MKRTITLLLAIVFCFLTPVHCYANEKNEDVKAKSVVLMCMDTGDVLYKENEFEHLSPASVTKIMSLLLICEAIDNGKIALSDKVSASANAVAMGGSQIWLEVGETMTVEELLKAVIVASANDACTALSEYVAGSTTSFVKMMNEKVSELGLTNSNFENCTGLDDDVKNHYSCAYDLAVISKELMKHKIITKYTTIWLDSLRDGKTELNNTNKLVNTYEGITGLKTGTTSNAGFCVSATAQRDNMNLVAVVLGSDTSEDRFNTAAYLLDSGFANYEIFNVKIDKSKITQIKVKMGEDKTITPAISKSSKIVIEKGNNDFKYKYHIEKEVAAPIKKGDKLGYISILNGNNELKRINLVANKTINKVSLKGIWHDILINI